MAFEIKSRIDTYYAKNEYTSGDRKSREIINDVVIFLSTSNKKRRRKKYRPRCSRFIFMVYAVRVTKWKR